MNYENQSMAMPSKGKMPYHIEKAESAFSDLCGLDHKEQVEAFKYLQKKIVDQRIDQATTIKKQLEAAGNDVCAMEEGTKLICSAL